jgi:hypothetical protein
MVRMNKPPRNLIQPINLVNLRKRLLTTARMARPHPLVQVHQTKTQGNVNPLEDLSHLKHGSGRRWSVF